MFCFVFFAKLVGVYSYYVFDTPDTFCMLTSFRRRGAEVFHIFFITVLADSSAGFEVNELFGTEGQFFRRRGRSIWWMPLVHFPRGGCLSLFSWFMIWCITTSSVCWLCCSSQALCLFSGFLVEKKQKKTPYRCLFCTKYQYIGGRGEGVLVLCRLRESAALLFTVNSRQWVFEKQPDFFDFVVYLEAFFCWEKVKVGEPHQTSTKAFLHHMSSPSLQHFYCIIFILFFFTLWSHTFGTFFSAWQHISG